MSLDFETRNRNVIAVLGPTNTGKTHLAIERMLNHESGLIGLPLRLLAREVYDKVAERVGAEKVALITGEEKIKPDGAKYFICTVEAMPADLKVEFLAIDEIQLAADADRGHVFTDRLLNSRGRAETLLLGSATMRDAISDLVPGANFITRPRLSKLTYAGEKKITRLPPRSAIVAFSANDVYAIAELIRRQRGGTAVVLGALSPRTRNAQVALFQNGDVDFLVATDAIGMGLNLNVDHVALAALRKFDGEQMRDLTPLELGQIAGRAGRHTKDGTFGVTNGVEAMPADMIERLESHQFDPVKLLQWRTRDLNFGSIDALRDSLGSLPPEARLQRARLADDQIALEHVALDPDVLRMATTREAVMRLWEVCQVPDYRKISQSNHAELIGSLYKHLMGPGRKIPEDWFREQVAQADRTDGDIDTLSTRLAHIRTWTFVSQRKDWLQDPAHWQGRTREIEDQLSDALHEQLTQRFVDRRTSALMRGMRDKEELYADIADDGAVKVENHFVGKLRGFRFQPAPEPEGEGVNAKALRAATNQVLAKEISMRVRRIASAKPDAFKLARNAEIMWRNEAIAHLEKGESPLKPMVVIDADDMLQGNEKEQIQERLNTWVTELIAERLKPLVEIQNAEDISGLARGIGFRLIEALGALRREDVAEEVKTLDQPSRGQLRKYGVRFGAYNIFLPPLLKPAPAELALILAVLKDPSATKLDLAALPEPPRGGLTSIVRDQTKSDSYYRLLGYHICGPRAVRYDMLERLADQIRPLVAWRRDPANPDATPPKGAAGEGAFKVTPEMMSILGCSGDEMSNVLNALGFASTKRPIRVPSKSAGELALAAALAMASPPKPERKKVDVDPTVAAADGTGETPKTAEKPAEPEMEEVWRPKRNRPPEHGRDGQAREGREGRRDQPNNRDRRQGAWRRRDGQSGPAPRDPAQAGAATANGGAPATPAADGTTAPRTDRPDRREGGGGRRDFRPRDGAPRDNTPRDGAPRDAARDAKPGDAKPGERRDSKPGERRDGDRGGRPPFAKDGKPGGGGRPAFGDRRDGDRGRGGERRDGRDNRDGKGWGRPLQQYSAAPPPPKEAPAAAAPQGDNPFAALAALKAKFGK